MDLRTNLINESSAYAEARGISLSRLASLVVNDGKFFSRLESGGSFTVRTYERFLSYFAAHPAHPGDAA